MQLKESWGSSSLLTSQCLDNSCAQAEIWVVLTAWFLWDMVTLTRGGMSQCLGTRIVLPFPYLMLPYQNHGYSFLQPVAGAQTTCCFSYACMVASQVWSFSCIPEFIPPRSRSPYSFPNPTWGLYRLCWICFLLCNAYSPLYEHSTGTGWHGIEDPGCCFFVTQDWLMPRKLHELFTKKNVPYWWNFQSCSNVRQSACRN